MSKLLDLLSRTNPANSRAKRDGVDKTPIDDVKFPFPNSRNLVATDLTNARGGNFGSFPGAPSGFTPPGYGPGQNIYSIRVPRR